MLWLSLVCGLSVLLSIRFDDLVAEGLVYGKDQRVILHLLEIEQAKKGTPLASLTMADD
jgi:hypothetical protein